MKKPLKEEVIVPRTSTESRGCRHAQKALSVYTEYLSSVLADRGLGTSLDRLVSISATHLVWSGIKKQKEEVVKVILLVTDTQWTSLSNFWSLWLKSQEFVHFFRRSLIWRREYQGHVPDTAIAAVNSSRRGKETTFFGRAALSKEVVVPGSNRSWK